MVQLGLALLGCFVESGIVNCLAAWTSEGKISEVYALEMPQFSVLG